ncbi:MAG TPA: TadE/TadG family type IV pilus assembly protein [Solirubrobacteraceae bacterium]|nr:TadE/TadG family type IV pilus assembly protein [Solirubrobacteraceae bacterium]
MPHLRSRLRSAAGQGSVELVVLLPVIALIALGVWQVAIAGHAVWAAGAAARAAARAEAVGGDAERAARRLLPRRVRSGAEVSAKEDGEVRVEVPIPAVAVGGSLFTTTARARFEPQR